MSSATMTQAVPAPGTFKVIAAASIGNALEWYDILVYGYFAVTISHLFFPTVDPVSYTHLTLPTNREV